MNISVITVGKIGTGFASDGAEEYLSRIKRLGQAQMVAVKAEKLSRGKSEKEVKDIEGQRLLRQCASDSKLVAMDLGGLSMSSEKVAEWLQREADGGSRSISFLVGGPVGLSKDVLARAGRVWSLSPLTFPHELVPMILLETLYRAMTINRNLPYHR